MNQVGINMHNEGLKAMSSASLQSCPESGGAHGAPATRRWTMGDYIAQAPGVARANIDRRDELLAPLLACCSQGVPDRIRLVASGSSFNACQCMMPFMRSCLPQTQIRLVTPHRFTYYEPEVTPGELVMVVTQSGMSTNALAALDVLRVRGERSICLCGNVDSDARSHADVLIDWGVGEELVGYVTKGVTTLALFLGLFACRLGNCEQRMVDLERAVEVSDAVRRDASRFFERFEKELTSMSVCYCVAPWVAQGVACEGALKIGETVHVPSVAYETEEFIHGPNLQLTPAYTLLFFDAGDASSARTRQIWRASREVSDHAFLITCENADPAADVGGAVGSAAELLALRDDPHVLVVPCVPDPTLASLAYLPFVQTLSYRASAVLGSTKQHPLLRRFKARVSAKSEGFVNYDGDE